ncbi:MAG: hypothetical protein P4M05_10060 [Bradyrhizobium sp.]|nr:hypothetical protein [Bradyrhizobium sp.]
MAVATRKFIDENGPEIMEVFRLIGANLSNLAKGVGELKDDFTTLREVVALFTDNTKPMDWEKFLGLTGLNKTLDVFVATWRARWDAFKAYMHLGTQEDADRSEAERKRLFEKDFPDQPDVEGKWGLPGALTPEQIPQQPSDKTELQRLRDWWNGTPGPNFRGQGYGGSATTTPPPGAISPGPAPGTISPPPKKMNYTVPENSGAGIIKASYAGWQSEGPNPLRAAQSSIKFPAEETLGGGASSTSDAINVIAIGTRKGVYDGMIDYYQYLLGTKSSAGGVTPASFGGSSGAAAGGGIDAGGGGLAGPHGGAEEPRGATAPGGPPVGKENLGAGEKPAHFDLAAIRSAITSASPTGGGSAYLARERADLAADIAAHPGDRATLRGMLAREDARDPAGPMEALANRWAYLKSIGKHPTIHSMLHSGFYGSGNANHPMGPNKKYDAAIDRVLGGSNKLQGAADQGTYGDPNSNYILQHWRAQYPGMSPSAIYGDWAAGASKAFRLRDQAAMRESDAGETSKMARESAALHGAALREHFGHREAMKRAEAGGLSSPGDLLKHARTVGMAGSTQHTITGRAGVDINLTGFPRGTIAQASSSGIFNEVKLARGHTPRAEV